VLDVLGLDAPERRVDSDAVITGAWILSSIVLLAPPTVGEQRVTPPSPRKHFSDATARVPAAVARRLDARLARYERESTNQVVVAVFTKLPWTPMEEFTLATANAWGVGQKDRNNGVVLFVFMEDHLLRLEVGSGLEKSLTNALAQRILDETVTPRLRAGDLGGALEAGAEAVITVLSGGSLPAPPLAPGPDH
jgi:uncharacterized protein